MGDKEGVNICCLCGTRDRIMQVNGDRWLCYDCKAKMRRGLYGGYKEALIHQLNNLSCPVCRTTTKLHMPDQRYECLTCNFCNTWFYVGPDREKAWGEEDAPPSDPISHPPHYTSHPSGIECITITEHMNFCLGNAIKYIWRAGLKGKNNKQDLLKAAWYIDKEIDRICKGTEDEK